MKLDVFFFASACMFDTLLTVLTSLQTLHRGLKAWMSHNLTLRANNKTSIFKMSPLRLNSSMFTMSFCLHRLSVSTWLNSIAQWKYKEDWLLWHLFGDLRDFCSLSAMDGGPVLTVLLMETSARQQVLTLFFCLRFSINHVFSFCFRRDWGRTKVNWGGGLCKDSWSVRKYIRTGEIICVALIDLSLCLFWHRLLSKWHQICFLVAGHVYAKRKQLTSSGQNWWVCPWFIHSFPHVQGAV